MSNTKSTKPITDSSPHKIKTNLSLLGYEYDHKIADNSEHENNGVHYTWGSFDKFPMELWDAYMGCSTLQSVLNGCADYTFGKGIIDNTGIIRENQFGDTVSDVVDKICLDRWVFGGFAIQVKYNQFGKIIGISHIDPRKCRVSVCGNFIYVYNIGNYGLESEGKMFNKFNPETGAQDGVQIYFYKGHRTRGIYPVCDYIASLISCETQVKIQQFNYNELDNNFMGTLVAQFYEGKPEEDVAREIEQKLNKKHSGYRNAARWIIAYSDGKENGATFDRIDTDDLPDRYKNVYDTSQADIFIALRAHPQLFGMSVSTGFADIEYSEAWDLFNNTQVQKKQGEIQRVFAKIFDREDAIVFKPFEISANTNNV